MEWSQGSNEPTAHTKQIDQPQNRDNTGSLIDAPSRYTTPKLVSAIENRREPANSPPPQSGATLRNQSTLTGGHFESRARPLHLRRMSLRSSLQGGRLPTSLM
jgi:hypothetical protein